MIKKLFSSENYSIFAPKEFCRDCGRKLEIRTTTQIDGYDSRTGAQKGRKITWLTCKSNDDYELSGYGYYDHYKKKLSSEKY